MGTKQFVTTINAPKIAGKYRNQTILEAFNQLRSGEKLKLINDHDPKPLYYQFVTEIENLFTWEYLQKGPSIWKVAIGKK